MSMQDPVADMLSRIRNGYKRKILTVEAAASKFKSSILHELRQEGYIADFEERRTDSFANTLIHLKYSANGDPAVESIDRVSKSSRRVYISNKDLKEYRSGLGIYILSTPLGVMSDKKAKHHKVGGEVICKVF